METKSSEVSFVSFRPITALILSFLTSPADISECWNGPAPSLSLSSCIFLPLLLVMLLCLGETAALVGFGVSATLFSGRLLPAARVALRCNCAAASGKSWRWMAAGSHCWYWG